MSFLTYKPHVRQEGFHLPSPPLSATTPSPNASHSHGANTNNNLDLFHISGSNHFLPDAFRKFPSAANPENTATAMDFENELASLISQPQAQSSNERSTQSPHPRSYDENGNYPRHMFDAVPLPSSASSTTSAFSSHNHRSQHSQPSSLHSPTTMSEFTPPHTQFNTAMRYDSHHSHPHHSDGSGPPPPPSSYHFNNRHTPSPIHSQSQPPHNQSTQSRSRSRSRPSSGSSGGATGSNPGTVSGVGPTRTTRTRRNSSFSSTSPPPGHHHHHPGRPQAIVIPRSASNGHTGSAMSPISASGGQHENGAAWYIPNNPASEFSLSESLHSHPSHSGSALHQGYTPFSLPSSTPNGASSSANHNSSDMHLPPVSALHSHSLPKSDITAHFSPSGLPGSYPVQGMNGMGGLNGGNIGNMNVNNINLAGALAGPGSPISPPLNSPIGISSGGLGPGLNSNLNSGLNGLNGATKAAALTAEEKQNLIANEKRRRRRESHNAVERRRRDNINERISELATLIPECMLEAGSSQNQGSSSPHDDGVLPSPVEATSHVDMMSSKMEDPDMHANGGESGNVVNGASANSAGVMKANKGIILRRSVEYIRYLQQLVTAQGTRNRELEAELKAYRAAAGVSSSPSRSASSTDGSGDERKDTDSGLGSEPGRNDSSSPPMASDGEISGIHGIGYRLVNGHKGHHAGHAHHPHAHPNGDHHGHGHGHMRNGSGGFGSFGGMFALPSMPEGDSEEGEEGDEDMYRQVDMNDMMDGALGGMGSMAEERLNRGRARLKVHTGGPGKIKKEQDLIAMEA